MSKPAVFVLLFFILAVTIAEPLITKGLVRNASGQTINYNSAPSGAPIISGDSLLAANYTSLDDRLEAKALAQKRKTIKTIVTAYTSSVDETDDTPFITASGRFTEYGVVAANFLPIGAQIRLPKLFGEQIFVVEDRLHTRYNNRVDIWLPTKDEAINFGLKVSEIEVL